MQPKTRLTLGFDHPNLSDQSLETITWSNVSCEWLHFIAFSFLNLVFWTQSSLFSLVLRNFGVLSIPNSRSTSLCGLLKNRPGLTPSGLDFIVLCVTEIRDQLPNSILFASLSDAGGMQPISFSQVGLTLVFIGCIWANVALWR